MAPKAKKTTRGKAPQRRAAKGAAPTPRPYPKRRSEGLSERPRCPICGVPVAAIGTPPPEVGGAWKWAWGGCTECTEEKIMSLKLSPGGAYDISSEQEVPPFDIVEVDAAVAARCVYKNRTKHIEGDLCAVFKDEQTGKWYAQPVEVAT